MRNVYRVLVRKPGRKRPTEKPSRRWNNIRMDPKEIGFEGMDWKGTSGGAVVNTVMNVGVS